MTVKGALSSIGRMSARGQIDRIPNDSVAALNAARHMDDDENFDGTTPILAET